MKSKKFFSDEAGFSLIELIVVIAIMAILGGTAVVGYSAYVRKANEAADRQMISDIEHALILGAYSESNGVGGVIGAVGISSDAPAAADGGVEVIMDNAFGDGWENTMNLKSDHFASSDSAKIIAAINAAQIGDKNVFNSVPGSSFYQGEGSTDALVADVDEIAGALNNVLNGIGESSFKNFWGSGFHQAVDGKDLTSTWKDDDQVAANLTVFAAANGITNADENTQKDWIDSWGKEEASSVNIETGYVADLVMNYAQCVALNNYAKQHDPNYYIDGVDQAYASLEASMQNMKNSKNYVNDFNTAISNFRRDIGKNNITAWQTSIEGGKSQAQIDAEAFMASMAAISSMEDNYVNKNQVELLGKANAFEEAGAARVLDTMVTYSSMGNRLPDGEYVIVLSIGSDGIPVVTPTLKEE